MTPQYQSQMIGAPIDKTGILERVNPRPDIEQFMENILGLKRITENIEGRKVETIKRINRPMFTYEYALTLQRDIMPAMSFTVQVTRWQKERIKLNCLSCMQSVCKSLAIHGDENYISPQTWEKIREYDRDGVWTKDALGVVWDYHKPVTYDMLILTKNENEEAEQILEFQKIMRQLILLIEGSMNKGYAADDYQQMGQFPSMMAETYRETTRLDGLSNIRPPGMTGGGEQQWT